MVVAKKISRFVCDVLRVRTERGDQGRGVVRLNRSSRTKDAGVMARLQNIEAGSTLPLLHPKGRINRVLPSIRSR